MMKKKNTIIYKAHGINKQFSNLEDAIACFLNDPMCINILIEDKTNGWYCGYMREIFELLKKNKIHTFTCLNYWGSPIRNKIELKDKNFIDKFDLSIYNEREKFISIRKDISDSINKQEIIAEEKFKFYNEYLLKHNH